jgi:hypothetical protein
MRLWLYLLGSAHLILSLIKMMDDINESIFSRSVEMSLLFNKIFISGGKFLFYYVSAFKASNIKISLRKCLKEKYLLKIKVSEKTEEEAI